MNRIRENYNHTIYACYFGLITQAIINNFAPLLFLTFQKTYQISFEKIALLVSINFGVQLLVDALAARWAEKIGYRISLVAAHIFSGVGLIFLAVLPDVFANPYLGILTAVICYAVGGGLIEVLASPTVEACPTEKKESAMSLLHSFYCWGHVAVVIVSTLFFSVFGIAHWKWMAFAWSVIPFINAVYFKFVPLHELVEEGEGMTLRELLGQKVFWILFVVMICSGASEQGMSQWASAFAEAGLGVSKTVGDLAGPCLFAVLMGISRAFYGKFGDKISLHKFMMASGVLCVISYLVAGLVKSPILGLAGCAFCGLAVGIMWPGTCSTGAKVLRRGGTMMFAMFALAGDIGCSVGPGLVGIAADFFGNDLKRGILVAIIFPILLMIGINMNRKGQEA